jgi:hypothetical protein
VSRIEGPGLMMMKKNRLTEFQEKLISKKEVERTHDSKKFGPHM